MQITAEKNGTLIPVNINEGSTLEQILQKFDEHPSFSGSYTKYLTREGVYVSSLIGVNGIPLSTVLVAGDKISFISKIEGGKQ